MGALLLTVRGTLRKITSTSDSTSFFATAGLFDLYPYFIVNHLPIYKSDHAPILLKANRTLCDEEGDKPFKFESLWLSNEESKRIVEESWNESLECTIQDRIENCGKGLSDWAGRTFGELKKKIKQVEKSFARAQKCVPDARILQNVQSH